MQGGGHLNLGQGVLDQTDEVEGAPHRHYDPAVEVEDGPRRHHEPADKAVRQESDLAAEVREEIDSYVNSAMECRQDN